MLKTDYDFYKEIYGGTSIPSNQFLGLSIRVGYFINKITFNRIDENNISYAVKMALCAVADELYSIQKVGAKTTETVGNHTVSYLNDTVSKEKKFYSIAKMYLPDELLYRGVY